MPRMLNTIGELDDAIAEWLVGRDSVSEEELFEAMVEEHEFSPALSHELVKRGLLAKFEERMANRSRIFPPDR